MTEHADPSAMSKTKLHPFRRAVLRGLAIVMPPLLTIVLFIWAWNTIESYVFVPLESTARYALVWTAWDVVEKPPEGAERYDLNGHDAFKSQSGRMYVQLPGRNQWIPAEVHANVEENPDLWPPNQPPPTTAKAFYHQYARNVWLPRSRIIPLFVALFIGLLYLLGKFVAAGVGRWLVSKFEALMHRLPVIRNVYSSVKQVTDFVFVEQEIEYTRVVAIEYPRKGIWSLGFVTGESMLDIAAAANEPVLSVLVPTSPMPVTGFTVTIKRSEAVDLNLTIDQAIQFIVSCGVVVPKHQQARNSRVSSEIAAALAKREAELSDARRNGDDSTPQQPGGASAAATSNGESSSGTAASSNAATPTTASTGAAASPDESGSLNKSTSATNASSPSTTSAPTDAMKGSPKSKE